jgi:imidazoleglycerol-phosphate dehydratase
MTRQSEAILKRTATVTRTTKETAITLSLNIDGSGQAEIKTGIGFLDHMLTALSQHAGFDLTLHCTGDTHIDDHHTAEDCGIVLGEALAQCVNDKRGITRFGYAYAPLDEALARAVVDCSGRAGAHVELQLQREMIGQIASENIQHVLESLVIAARFTVHVDVLRGRNDHHKSEAAFKALALALRQAVQRHSSDAVPSTKGVLA